MLKRQPYIAFGIVFLIVLVLLNLPARLGEQIKLATGAVFYPLFGLASSTQQITSAAGSALLPRTVLIAQLQQIKEENQALKIRALQWEEVQQENNRLKDALGRLKQTPWKIKMARVIARDPANWWKTVHIDLGNRDGLKPNLPVVTPEGLVGRVSQVSESYSLVILVGDPNCRVAALIQETRDTTGVIVPPSMDTLDNLLVDLTFISRNSVLKPGQKVYTSGQGGIFPKGLAIGQVVDWRMGEYGLQAEARVKLSANLNRLEEVFVLWP
jgi:rod shape-determining protein MreC